MDDGYKELFKILTDKDADLSSVRSNELLGCPFCGASKWEISFYGIEGRSQAKLNHEPNCFFHAPTRLFLPSDAYIEWNRRAT